MKKLKEGDKVVCKNKNIAKEYTGQVGEIRRIVPSVFLDLEIAIVQYTDVSFKIPVQELNLYVQSSDEDEIILTRKQFRAAIKKSFPPMIRRMMGCSGLRALEDRLFGK